MFQYAPFNTSQDYNLQDYFLSCTSGDFKLRSRIIQLLYDAEKNKSCFAIPWPWAIKCPKKCNCMKSVLENRKNATP